MKKFAYLSFALPLSLLLLWGAGQLLVCAKAGPWIERSLRQANIDVSVGKVRSNFLHKFTIDRITVRSPQKLEMSNIRLSILPALFPVRIFTKFELNAGSWGDATGTASLGLVGDRPWRATVRVQDLKSEEALANLFAQNPTWGKLSGLLDAQGRAKGALRKKDSLEWNVDLQSKRLQWMRATAELPLTLSGGASVSPEQVTIPSLRINKSIHLKGNILSPFAKPSLQLTLRSNNSSIENVLNTITGQPASDLVGGNLTSVIQINGAADDPHITGNFSATPVYARVQLPEAQGNFEYSGQKLEVKSDFAGGQAEVHGSLAENKPKRFSLSFENVALGEVAKKNRWNNVHGLANSQLQFSLSDKNTELTGQFQINQFRWGRFQTKPLIAGRIDINKDSIRINTDDKSLILKATIQKEIARLEEFHIEFAKNSRLNAQGKANLSKSKLDFVLSGKNIPPDLWPPLVARYPAITGALNLNGTLKGSTEAPNAEGDISFSELKFLPQGGSWNGTAKLIGSNEKVSLSQISVDGGYSGELSWIHGGPNNLVTAKAEMSHANPLLLADILKTTATVAGEINGQFQLEMKSGQMLGASSFTWINGQVGEQFFDRLDVKSKMEPEKIVLEEVSVLRGSQALRGTAEADFSEKIWNCAASLQLQHWGGPHIYIDGETLAKAKVNWPEKSFEANVTAPVLWLNDYSVDNAAVQVKMEKDLWSVKGKADPEVTFNVKARSDGSDLSGTVVAKSVSIGDFFSKMFPRQLKRPEGQVDAELKLAGRIDAPRLTAQLKTGALTWHKETLSATVDVEINSSTIVVSEASGRLAKGGTFSFKGAIPRTGAGEAHLIGKGSALNLQSVFNLMGWNIKWEGQTDATLAMTGAGVDRQTEITFSGEHKGFGMFAGHGQLSGRVVERFGEWDISEIRIDSGEGFARLLPGSRIYIDKNGAGTMRVVADTRNLQAGLVNLFGVIEAAGSWKAKSNLESLDQPPIQIDLFARSLWLNQFVLDGNVTHLTVRKGAIDFLPIAGSGQKLSGELIYSDYPEIQVKDLRLVDKGTDKIYLNGAIGVNHWDYEMNVRDVDSAVLGGLLDTNFNISGNMDLKLKGKGSVKAPDISGTLVWKDAHVDILPIDVAQCNIRYYNGWVEVTDLEATKKRGFQLTGKIRFPAQSSDPEPPEPEMDLVVEKGDFAFLREMFPDISKARGSFSGRFRAGQKSWGRSVSGYFTAQKVSINSAYTPKLEKGEIRIRLDKNRLHIDEASAKLGDGTLRMAGYVDFAEGRPSLYNLSLRTENERGISIRIPQLAIMPGPLLGRFGIFKGRLATATRGEPLVNLIFKGPADHPLLAGTIELVNTIFTYPPIKTKRNTEQTKTELTRWFKSFLEGVKWDVSLIAGARTWYQNELVDANVTGQLQFAGMGNDLDIDGKIITEQGAIIYSGNEFRIKNAVLEVETKRPLINDVDVKKTYVYLKANAEKEVYYSDALSNSNQDTIVMVVDRALLGEIQPRFYAKGNPNLSSERAFQLALGLPVTEGVDTNNLLPDQRGEAQSQSNVDTDAALRLGLVQLLDSSLASPLARAIARNTGLVDYVRVTYQEQNRTLDNTTPVGSNSNNSTDITQNQFLRYAKGTKVKFGRGVSNRFFADYSFRVDEYQNKIDLRHEVELSYRLRKSLFLKGITELDREQQLGRPPDRRATLENQWRFGLPKKKNKPPQESKLPSENTAQTRTKRS